MATKQNRNKTPDVPNSETHHRQNAMPPTHSDRPPPFHRLPNYADGRAEVERYV